MARVQGAAGMVGAKRAYDRGNFDEAIRACKQVLRKDKANVGAHEMLANIAMRKFDYDTALSEYRRCAKMKPREAGYQFQTGRILTITGRYDEALSRFDRALELDPDHRLAAGWKAGALERSGAYEDAKAVLAPWIDAGTEHADMAELRAKLDIHTGDYAHALEIARRHIDADETSDSDRKALLYQVGRAQEKTGEYDESFAAFHRADEITKTLLPEPFDPVAYERFVELIIETWSPEQIEILPLARNETERPVFIAGMPRSGTTLVEQIIDAHPNAFGAGELNDIDRLPRRLPSLLDSYKLYPKCLPDLNDKVLNKIANEYLTKASRLARGADRIVNKSLENYKHLGLISRMFPKARIIHCRREPLDACLSCYMGGFMPTRAPWVTDLEHLGVVQRSYERLMDHWATVLDLDIIEVKYEDVVEDLESQARRIIEHLGLEWDDRCLEFHASGRTVLTLSYAQVTQPIYRHAVERFKHYESHLEPLKRAMAGG